LIIGVDWRMRGAQKGTYNYNEGSGSKTKNMHREENGHEL
jgi:hypothetical protein